MTDRMPDPESVDRRGDDPVAWFEPLYAAAARGEATVPWDRGAPHPLLVAWAEQRQLAGHGRSALIVGSGLGDNAEYIASLGFETLAFDVSPSAIAAARERFPDSRVTYLVGDLLAPPSEWTRRFDLVVEIYTVQALPIGYHAPASRSVGEMVAPGGMLIVISAARADDQRTSGPPWPLTRSELDAFAASGLVPLHVEDLVTETPPFPRHWRAEFTRPS